MKKVSVIIPSKNRFEFTEEALRSVFLQKINDAKLEVIVVDDLSSPSLKSVLNKKFPKVKFIKNKSHRHGPGPSRNIGLKYATGDYIAFLDNDDQWKSNFLKLSLDTLYKNNAPCTLCFTKEFFDGEFSLVYRLKIRFLNLARLIVLIYCVIFNKRQLPRSGFFLGQLSHMVFKNEFIKKLKFDEDLAAGEDMKFIAQATNLKEALIIPKKLVKFRYEPKSNTQSIIVRTNKWKAYRFLLKSLPPTHKKGLLHLMFLKYIRIFES